MLILLNVTIKNRICRKEKNRKKNGKEKTKNIVKGGKRTIYRNNFPITSINSNLSTLISSSHILSLSYEQILKASLFSPEQQKSIKGYLKAFCSILY